MRRQQLELGPRRISVVLLQRGASVQRPQDVSLSRTCLSLPVKTAVC